MLAGTSGVQKFVLVKVQEHTRLAVRTVAFLLFGLSCSLAAPQLCIAQVQLPTVNLGDTNFEDAFGGRGWLFEEFPEANIASEVKDSRGKTVPGSNRVTAYSATTHIAFVSKQRVLGGWFAVEMLQPVVDLEVQPVNGATARVRGFADMTVGAGVQWAPKKFAGGVLVHRAVLDVGLPTGKYSDLRPVNIGNHFVVVDPYYAVTYERRRTEFSIRLHYLWNSTNDDPFVGFGIRSMQSGQAFHVNYATSYELWKNIRFGFNGYWLQQLIEHQINGADVPNSRERTVGLGPGLQFGGQTIWFRLNSYLETDVRNRASGIKVTLRISKALPTAQQ